MVLGWPGAELIGITTSLDRDGERAGCVARCLALLERDGIPFAAGASASLTTFDRFAATAGDPRYWPEPVPPRPSPAGAALDLLTASIEQGATIVVIGATTNLALLEVARPGTLAGASVVLMGGWVDPPDAGLPAWGPERDWNVQCDPRAAQIVADAAAQLTLVPIPGAIGARLRAVHLPRLRASGPFGALLARQSEAWREDRDLAQLARSHFALPDDLVNFHWDPVTCAVALGWPGAVVEDVRLRIRLHGDVLLWERDAEGRPVRVLTGLDGPAFDDVFLAAIEAAQA